MQIRPGGEKLSDTKVGEFDHRPLSFFPSLSYAADAANAPSNNNWFCD